MAAFGKRWLKSDATVADTKGLRVSKFIKDFKVLNDPNDLKVPHKMGDVSIFMRKFVGDFSLLI